MTITVNISKRPNNMQNVVNNLVKAFKELQSLVGPIAPNPGPIFPIEAADIDNDDIISNPFRDINNVQATNIKI